MAREVYKWQEKPDFWENRQKPVKNGVFLYGGMVVFSSGFPKKKRWSPTVSPQETFSLPAGDQKSLEGILKETVLINKSIVQAPTVVVLRFSTSLATYTLLLPLTNLLKISELNAKWQHCKKKRKN